MLMRARSLMLGLVGALAGVGFLAQSIRSPTPFDLRIVSVAINGGCNLGPVDPTKAVTVEFRLLNPAARLTQPPKIQARIAGQWQAPEKFPELEYPLLWRTNREQVTFLMPAAAEACRFSMQHRNGKGVLYC